MTDIIPFNNTTANTQYVVTSFIDAPADDHIFIEIRENAWDNKNGVMVAVERDEIGDLKERDRITADWNYIEMILVPQMTCKVPLLKKFEILGEDYEEKIVP